MQLFVGACFCLQYYLIPSTKNVQLFFDFSEISPSDKEMQ